MRLVRVVEGHMVAANKKKIWYSCFTICRTIARDTRETRITSFCLDIQGALEIPAVRLGIIFKALLAVWFRYLSLG